MVHFQTINVSLHKFPKLDLTLTLYKMTITKIQPIIMKTGQEDASLFCRTSITKKDEAHFTQIGHRFLCMYHFCGLSGMSQYICKREAEINLVMHSSPVGRHPSGFHYSMED